MAFDFDLDKLKAEQDAANEQKRNLGIMGAIGDTLSNSQSFGNFYTGHMNPQDNGSSRLANDLASSIEDPVARQAKLYEMYKAKQESSKLDSENERVNQLKDPNSTQSKALLGFYSQLGVKADPSMSGYDAMQMYGDPGKLFQERQRAQTEFDNQKNLKAFEHQNKMAELQTNLKAPKGYKVDIDPETGKRTLVQESGNFKPNQYQAATYGRRLEQSNAIMNELAQSGYDRSDTGRSFADYLTPTAYLSDDRKRQDQAERNFVNALLRRESGSAISQTEFDSAEKQYFPRAGDSPKVLAQKAQNREQALAGLRAESSGAWNEVPLVKMPDASGNVARNKNDLSGLNFDNEAQAAPVQYTVDDLNKMSDADIARLHRQVRGGK